MGRKAKGEINKSQLIREAFAKNPAIKVKDLVADFATRGIDVQPNLAYLIKAKLKGARRRRRVKNATGVAVASGSSDALATIQKVKKLAVEVGGLRTLRALVEALSD